MNVLRLIINKAQIHTPTNCFILWWDHQGYLIQKELVDLMIPPKDETVCRSV